MYQSPATDGGPLGDLLHGLVEQPMVGYSSQEVATRTPQATAEEQTAVVTDHRPMASPIPGVPVTARQGLWGEVPQLEATMQMSAPSWHVPDPWRAPNIVATDAPADHRKGWRQGSTC